MNQIAEARGLLAQTVFDPTLRQLQAELFAKERAAIVANQALVAAEATIRDLEGQVLRLEARIAELAPPAETPNEAEGADRAHV